MHDVIVHRVVDEDQVADVLRVGRNLQLESILHGAHAGHGVDGGAHAAEALSKQPRFTRVAPEDNVLNAAPHGAACPGFGYLTAIHLGVNPKVTFNPCNWVDIDSCRHSHSVERRDISFCSNFLTRTTALRARARLAI